MRRASHLCTVEEAIIEARKGKMLLIVDEARRENEADLYVTADRATPKALHTMITDAGGILCTAVTRAQAARLGLTLMVPLGENTEKTQVNFTIAVDAKRGITTGVSAYDRAKTIKILANPRSTAARLAKPGHVLGLVARDGGVLERPGHTEAAVDLARLAGRRPAGVLCEVVGTDGRMAKRAEIERLAGKLGIRIVAIRDIIAYLKKHPLPPVPVSPSVTRVSSASLPTRFGTFSVSVYRSEDGREHAALVLGKPRNGALVRVHSRCLTGDTLFSLRCDCGEQLEESMRRIGKAGAGVIVYLDQEGRGIGLGNKIKAYALQDKGFDTVEANCALGFSPDSRTYEAAADILKDLGIARIRLMTNNPEKERQLSAFGIGIAEIVPLEIASNGVNARYLRTKKRKMGHRLSGV